LKARPADRRIGEMDTDDEMDTEGAIHDISALLIAKKAGYGLARPKWHTTLEQIRRLPELGVRPAT
jgi:hypothetical protein